VSRANTSRTAARVFIGIGSNLGDRRARIEHACRWLSGHREMRLSRTSEIIETEPWGGVSQPRFLNAVAEITTGLEPGELLAELKGYERSVGRDLESGPRWGPREIDLDILLFGDRVLESADLTIPHPRLTEREFVIRQLRDLDPDLIHPGTGKLVSSYLRVT